MIMREFYTLIQVYDRFNLHFIIIQFTFKTDLDEMMLKRKKNLKPTALY